ncbi:MAG: tRNA lysidine(34) synthetase TilS [Terriglobales bacterium]
MHELATRLLRTIRKQDLLHAGDRVAVAVSGGADSVALLCLFEELRPDLGIVLSVAHVNHKLRGAESDQDEQFVRELAGAHSLDFHAVDAPVNKRQPTEGDAVADSGVEASARKLRYDFFGHLARRESLSRIATAHTLDDQAETVLLRIFRGTGIRGLAGVHPRFCLRGPRDDESADPATMSHEGSRADDQPMRIPGAPKVVRPLLGLRRAELRDYLQARGQEWREDSSNEDMRFLRNRVRKQLLPIIADEYGAAAIEHIAELAEIARAEEEWCSKDLSKARLAEPALSGPSLDVQRLLESPLAVQRRLVRAWLEANTPEVSVSFRLIEEILELACAQSGKTLQLGRQPAAARQRTCVRTGRWKRAASLSIQIGAARRSHDYGIGDAYRGASGECWRCSGS